MHNVYQNSLSLARDKGIRSLSFPSISTGAYRFPIERAAGIALHTVRNFLKEYTFQEVRFVLFSEEDLRIYKEVWKGLEEQGVWDDLEISGTF